MDKLQVTKIGFERRDGKKVELTIKEAKELYEQLHELFGDKTVIIQNDRPIIIYKERAPDWRPWCPTWSGNTSDYTLKSYSDDESSDMRITWTGIDPDIARETHE